jgi:hypothetical protein
MEPSQAERDSLIEAAQARLHRLSPKRLSVAVDFLAYLEEREEDEATQELLQLPGFRESFQQAITQVEQGEIVGFRDIRRDV